MKKISWLVLLVMSVFTLSFVACDSDDDDQPIVESQLPQAARTFISQFYPDVKVSGITRDSDDKSLEYEVFLANGHTVTFDAVGQWVDVDAPGGQVIPDGIAPFKIAEYINQNYSGSGINEISRENYGYDVELTSGIDLEFNANGDFIRIDR